MKKRLVLMALAGVALAGCVNDEVADISQKQEQAKSTKIVFESPVMYDNSTGSRANYHGEVGGHQYTNGGIIYSYPKEENFQIFAVKHNGDFAGWATAEKALFNDKSVSYDLTVDGWAPKKDDGQFYFWDNDKKISFAACSPADLQQADGWRGRSYDAQGLKLENFTIPADAAQQFDLMFSERAVNKHKGDMNHGAEYYSGLPIKFQHALSSIRFSISNKSTYDVVLKKNSVYGVNSEGTFQENLREDEGDYKRYEIKENADDQVFNVAPAWTGQTTPVEKANEYIAFNGSLTFPNEPRYVAELVGEKTVKEDKVNHLLLLPQGLPDNAYLVVEYTVNNAKATKTLQLKTAKLVEKDSSGNEKEGDPITKWELGTRYTYRLVYSAAAADKDKIYFSPKSDNWKDAGVAVIDLASHVD